MCLPAHKVESATDEQIKAKRERLYSQVKLINQQFNDEVPAKRVSIRCGCLKLVRWQYMHRCLYCQIWYCKECAEAHFGAKVPNNTGE